MSRHVLIAALLLTGHAVHALAESGVLPPETGAFFQRLLPPSELTRQLDIEIDHSRARYRFRRGEAVAEIELAHPTTCAAPDGPMCVSRTRASGQGGEQLMAEASAAVVAALRRSAGGPGWITQETPPPSHWLQIGETFFGVLLGGVLMAVWRLRRRITAPDAGFSTK